MRFHSFEQPPEERVRELQEKIKIKSELKPQLAVIWPLSELREAAFEELKKEQPDKHVVEILKRSDDIIDRKIGRQLASIRSWYSKEKRSLTPQGKSPDYASWLFSTRKPSFAAKDPEELANTIEMIGDIVAQLKKKFGGGFIGVTLFGSITKGYWEGPIEGNLDHSDLDYMVVADNKRVSQEFKNMLIAKGIEPCMSCIYNFDSLSGESTDYRDKKFSAVFNLFHGLFLGDYKAFSKLQENTASNLTPQKWDDVRLLIARTESNLYKADSRLGISPMERAKYEAAALILRTPPAHEEALRFLRSRAR